MLYINDIIANRKNLKTKQKVQYKFAKNNNNNRINLQPNFQNMFHLQQYEDSHKEEVISYMENKNLLFFNEKFNRNHIKLLKIQKQQLIQNNYDSLQKSFLLLYGKLKLKPKQIKQAKKDTIQTAQQQYFKVLFQQFKIQDHNNDMIYIIKEQMGIGYLFNSLKYTNIEIYAQNALLLQINHSQNNFQHIIQNHFISHREQQNIIKDIKIFNSIVNFQKIYLHHFVTLKYKKGEIIYQINDQSSQFYLIIQGSVQFQSVILLTQIQNGLNLNKKQDRYKQFSIITQKLNRGGYFGQQEILKKKRRLQNVRCQSFECILLVLPGKIFQKCLQVTQFKNKMSEMADNKQQYRQSIIKNFLSLKDQNKQDHQNQMIMKTSNLQSTHFFKGMSHLNISRTNKNKNIKIIDNNQFQQTNIDNLKEKEFYMLDVNKNMYEHTLKRFRLSMQEIKKRKEPPSKNQQKGRSLQDIWKCLKLSNSIDLNRNKINLRNTSGLKYYNADLKIKAQLKASKSLKPRSLLKEYMPRIDKKDWSTLMICDLK